MGWVKGSIGPRQIIAVLDYNLLKQTNFSSFRSNEKPGEMVVNKLRVRNFSRCASIRRNTRLGHLIFVTHSGWSCPSCSVFFQPKHLIYSSFDKSCDKKEEKKSVFLTFLSLSCFSFCFKLLERGLIVSVSRRQFKFFNVLFKESLDHIKYEALFSKMSLERLGIRILKH